MGDKYIFNRSNGGLDIDNQSKKDKVTWGDQMLSGQRSVFPKQTTKQLSARLPNKDTYVHEQVTFDSAIGKFVGGKSKNIYEMKEAVNQNANFDQIEYLEALGNGEAWAFERNDKLMQIAQQDQEERFNDKILKRDKYKNAPNEIFKDSVKAKASKKASARVVLDALKKAEDRKEKDFKFADILPLPEKEEWKYSGPREREVKQEDLMKKADELTRPERERRAALDIIKNDIDRLADEKLKSEQDDWDRRYGLGGIPTIKRPD